MRATSTFLLFATAFTSGAWADPPRSPPPASSPPTPVAGLHLLAVPEAVYAHLSHLTPGQGLLVDAVDGASLGERIGVKRHDILLSLGGAPLKDADQFGRLLFALADNTSLAVLRGGKHVKVLIALKDEELPKALVKHAGLPEVTIKAQTLAADRVSLTLIYFPEGASKRVSVTVAGTLPEIEKQIAELNRRMPANVQDLVAVAIKKLRGRGDSQEK